MDHPDDPEIDEDTEPEEDPDHVPATAAQMDIRPVRSHLQGSGPLRRGGYT